MSDGCANCDSNWSTARLGDILPLSYGKSLTASVRNSSGAVPVYGSSGKVGSHSTALTTGATLVVGRKGSVGEVYYSPTPCWPIDTVYFVESTESTNLPFFAYLLRSLGLVKLDRSTAIPGLSRDDYNEIEVRLPPLPEQQRIVAEIEKQFTRLDAAIAALKRVKANLKRYRASVLKAACEGRLVPTEAELARAEGREYEPADVLLQRILSERRAKWEADELAKLTAKGKPPKDDGWKAKYKEPQAVDTNGLPELPEGWAWATVEQVGFVQGGIQKQPKRAPRQNAYPYLRVANVLRGALDLNEIMRLELFGDELERLRLQLGDLLVVEGNGSPSEIGRMAIWNDAIQDCVHQNHIIRIRIISPLLPQFVESYWNSTTGSDAIRGVASSTSGLYTLSVAKVQRIRMPLPPAAEQRRIVAEIDRRFSNLDDMETALSHSLQRAERLRQSILKRAFEGKLVPQDPNDEPASVLLERIRAERAESSPNGRETTRRKRTGKPATARMEPLFRDDRP